jgi:hypothetical protein
MKIGEAVERYLENYFGNQYDIPSNADLTYENGRISITSGDITLHLDHEDGGDKRVNDLIVALQVLKHRGSIYDYEANAPVPALIFRMEGIKPDTVDFCAADNRQTNAIRQLQNGLMAALAEDYSFLDKVSDILEGPYQVILGHCG